MRRQMRTRLAGRAADAVQQHLPCRLRVRQAEGRCLKASTLKTQACQASIAAQRPHRARTREAEKVERVIRRAPGVHVEHELLWRCLWVPLHHLREA